ncbi:larval cuticle protein 4-like [Haematobia irritans]|uniref:larval cuticle protein 4-like n=1 Tax=Haematobia irritans TaxID=7368 RepID=UPI003F501D2B
MFKFVLICTLIVAASAVSKFGAAKSVKSSFGGHAKTRSAPSSDDANAEVTHFATDVRADGFQYAFDTTNAIHAAASGDANGDIRGDFAWLSPEGEQIVLQYVADENGYQPSGDVLPTPHPIPEAILKSLEYIRTHPHQEESQQSFGHQSSRSFSQKSSNNFRKRF